MATALKPPRGERLTFVGWLQEEFRDRCCCYLEEATGRDRYDVAKFARQYEFAESTVRAWLKGRRRPSVEMCCVIADKLDLLPLEVKEAAGHVTWQEIHDYTHAYEDADNWATIGDL